MDGGIGRDTARSELRGKILREAIGIVHREGPRHVTMRSLAEKLGYSPATIYAHFENKQDLLTQIAMHGFRSLYARVSPSTEIEDPREAVAALTRAYIDFAVEHRQLYRLMFQDIQLSFAELGPEDQRWVHRSWEVLRDAYARGIQSGAFHAGDPETEASLGWAATHGFVQLVSSGRLPLGPKRELEALKALREAFIDSRLRSLRP